MKIFHLSFTIFCLKVTLCERIYSDYIDDIHPIHPNEVRLRPSTDQPHPNFHPAMRKTTRKPLPDIPLTTDSSCVKNSRKKQAEEEGDAKEYKPTGNRWHGAVYYGRELFPAKKQYKPRSTKYKDVTPVERRRNKCFKWIR